MTTTEIQEAVQAAISPIVEQLNGILQNNVPTGKSTPAKETKTETKENDLVSAMTTAVENFLKGNEQGKILDSLTKSEMPNLAQQEIAKEGFKDLDPGVQSYLKHKAHDEIGGKPL